MSGSPNLVGIQVFAPNKSDTTRSGITRAGHRAKLRMLAKEHGAWKQTLAMAHSWDGRGVSVTPQIVDAQPRFVHVGQGYRPIYDRGPYNHRTMVEPMQEQYRIHEPASPYMNLCSPRTPHDSTSFLTEVSSLDSFVRSALWIRFVNAV